MGRRADLFVVVALVALGCSASEPFEVRAQPPAQQPPTARAMAQATLAQPDNSADQVFVDVAAFERARAAGASVLDARGDADYATAHVPGAFHAPWQRFVDVVEGGRNGLLSSDHARLERELSRRGVSNGRPVLVYGDWDRAWGEEGRLFWMLEYLGHRDVRILSGGFRAYRAAKRPTTADVPPAAAGTFAIRPRPDLRATAADVHAALERGDAVILDIRTRAEYDGLTPHGAPRGGHVPRALHYYWHDVFDAAGRLRSATDLRARFGQLGIDDDTPVFAYCTGGIRSGFLYAVMRAAGFKHPRNYDGSWWEWSARQDLPIAR